MMRVLPAVLLSAVSLVGGHFYNRRWERAVIFLVLMATWGIGSWFLTSLAVTNADWSSTDEPIAVMTRYWNAFVLGMLLLWIASLGISAYDARRPFPMRQFHWNPSAVVAASALTVLCGAYLALLLGTKMMAGARAPEVSGPTDRPVAVLPEAYNFQHFLNFGRSRGSARTSQPPLGDGYLQGRFLYSGKPVEGVTVRLALNDQYESEMLTTDADGLFTLRVPPGEWRVNRVVTQSWKGKPEGKEFILASGREPKLGEGNYLDHFWINEEPLKIQATPEAGSSPLTFEIRDSVKLSWPPVDPESVPAKLGENAIAWEPYPEAQEYQLTVTQLRREGNTTYYHDVTTQRIKGATQFPLAKLEAVESRDGAKEYRVSVHAFAKDGSYLSSSRKFRDNVFVLADRELIREDDRKLLAGPVDAAKLEELRTNAARIQAVEVLIRDGLFDEAQRLLGKIQGHTDPGKKKAVTGYLLAQQGQCPQAEKYFTEALSEGGTNCVPDHYRAKCPNK